MVSLFATRLSITPLPLTQRVLEPVYSILHQCVLLLSCLDQLPHREEIAFAILKPGSFDWPCRRDTVDCRKRGHIVLFKDDPAGFESGDRRLDILHQPHRLGVGPAGLPLSGEDSESGVFATAVEKTSWYFALRASPNLSA
jgi:hypothetical protein